MLKSNHLYVLIRQDERLEELKFGQAAQSVTSSKLRVVPFSNLALRLYTILREAGLV